jgi:NAD+ kinase
MRALLYGPFGTFPEEIKGILSTNFEIVETSPEIVITYGGDGTLIGAERDYPQIPKLPLKNSLICKRCIPLLPKETIDLFLQNKLTLNSFNKLEAIANEDLNTKLLGLNDIVLRNKLPNTALRFNVEINSERFENLIGDGVVVSTLFGSTGYFHSITKSTFKSGFEIAFNNLTNSEAPIQKLVDVVERIVIEVIRENAYLTSDNNPQILEVKAGDKIVITTSTNFAKIYSL